MSGTRFWPRLTSLHERLSLLLLVLLLVIGVLGILNTLHTTRLHQMEVEQHLNADLAHQIAAMKRDTLLGQDGSIQSEGLQQLFRWLMVVNPSIEFYLLDVEGRILGYDAAPGKVKRQRVAMEPIQAFLAGSERYPILGEDPRDPARRKIFSVSPIPTEGEAEGYLYIILASEQVDSVVGFLRQSYVLRLSTWTILGYLAVTAVAGFLMFRRLTRPLRHLAGKMESFQETGTTRPQDASLARDEVARLEKTFEEMRQRIENQLAEIQRAEELRRELVANVSHDLRTPLASLQGYLDTLALKKSTLPEEDRARFLLIALRQSERLGRMIDELFELSKLEAKEQTPELETFSISELALDNLQRFRQRAEKAGIKLEADVDPEAPFVRADIGLIERVLENLIENGLRHTPSGGTVTLRVAKENGGVRVEVQDTGNGIAASDLPHIFDRFYRGQSSLDGRGTGLGLAISRRILELHGSQIDVEAAPGKGTLFRFLLPAKR